MRSFLIILGMLVLGASHSAQAYSTSIPTRLYECRPYVAGSNSPFGEVLVMALKPFSETTSEHGYTMILLTQTRGAVQSVSPGKYVNRPGRGGGKRYEFTMKEDINDPGFGAYVKYDLYWGNTDEGLLMTKTPEQTPYQCVLKQ